VVTDEQVRHLRQKLADGKTMQVAALAAGMSERSAYKYKSGPLPSSRREPRSWRTRKDPFEEVWAELIEPLLAADEDGELQSTELIKMLMEKRPGQFSSGQVRTLQRRVTEWRALHGPPKEVMFPQERVPGRECAIDFTHCTELRVTIAGTLFAHLLFHFVLGYSGWRWVQVALGETFEALVSGLQGALWALGGVPAVVRQDNLSAATHTLRESGGRALNKRFRDVLDHYGLESSRIEPGKGHQNGVAEKGHDVLKTKLAHALVERGSRDFGTVDEYLAFVRDVIERRMPPDPTRMAEERSRLHPLPSVRLPDYTKHDAKVRAWSTIHFAKKTYSVSSRLMGKKVEVRQFADHIEVYFRGKLADTMPRIRGEQSYRVDYRHVIWSLVRKPGAFARYRYREELFPTLTFRRAYDALLQDRGERADIEYVRILHLAASTMETDVEAALEDLLSRGKPVDYAAVKALAAPSNAPVPEVHVPPPNPAEYDFLLAAGGEP